MPTIAGLRRRGVPPEALRDFVERIGVAKANSIVDVGMLEYCDPRGAEQDGAAAHGGAAPAEGGDRELPGGPGRGARRGQQPRGRERPARRKIRFARELCIERDDFMEDPPKKFFRLSPGREVRLRYAYFVTCTRGGEGRRRARWWSCAAPTIPATRGGNAPPDGRKVQGTIHWVSAADAVDAEVRLYDQLFAKPDPGRRATSPPISTRIRWRC